MTSCFKTKVSIFFRIMMISFLIPNYWILEPVVDGGARKEEEDEHFLLERGGGAFLTPIKKRGGGQQKGASPSPNFSLRISALTIF